MAPPKDIARSYPKRGLTADVGFRSEPKFCGDGSIQLNGSNQYLNAELSSALGDSFTIMGWAKREGTSASYDYIVNTGNTSGAGNAISISITNANPGALYFFDNGTSVNTSNTVEFNEWFHFALTVAPGAGNVKLYKNGIDGTPSNTVAVDLSDVTFEVGRYLGGSNYFQGKLFDLRVYDETLTQDQIRELLNNPGQTVPTGLTSADLIHRYLFETNANDSGATGNNLTANNSPTFGVDRAQLPRGLSLTQNAAMAQVYTGRAVLLDGSADHLQATIYSNSSDFFSVSVWVNADAIGSNQNIVTSGNLGDNAFLIFVLSTGAVYFYGNDTTGDYAIIHQTTLTAGRWYHLAMTVDQSDAANNTIKAYIDGVENTTSKSAQGWAGQNVLDIGARGGATFFDGAIAGVKVFNSQLTAAQVRELYHNPEQVLPTGVSASNLRRYYPLSDYNDTGATGGRYFQDMGADGEPAEDKGSSSMEFAQPVPCPQLGLQQSASRIYWDDNAAEKLSATIPAFDSDFTIAFWWFRGSGVNADVWFEVNTPGLYQFYYDLSQIVYYSSTAGVVYTGVSCAVGEWSHIAITSAGIFKNGVKHTPAFTLDWLGTEYRIFGRHSAGLPCHGTCSSMGFWSDDLSTAEILELYNQGPDYDPRNDTGNYASSATLTNLWFMDDLTTIKDRKGSNDLTVIGDPILASFPENASGSTIVGDFTLKRRGVSVLNKTENDNDVIAIIPASADVFPTSQGFTCSIWVRGRKTTGNAYIVATTNTSTTQRYSMYTQNSANLWGLEMPVSAGSGSADAAVTYDPNEWACLSFTLDFGTNTAKMYTNGALQTTAARTLVLPTTFSDVNIGGSGATHATITGTTPVALFKAAQRTWSDDEVKRNYYSDLRLIKGLDNE